MRRAGSSIRAPALGIPHQPIVRAFARETRSYIALDSRFLNIFHTRPLAASDAQQIKITGTCSDVNSEIDVNPMDVIQLSYKQNLPIFLTFSCPRTASNEKVYKRVPKDGCSQDCKSVVSAVLTIKSQNNYTFVRKTNIELWPHYSRSCSAVSLLRILSGAKPMSITLNTKPMDSASSMNLNDL